MKGIEFAEVRDTIARVFSPKEFDAFLREHLDFHREVEVANGPLRQVVSDVLLRFEREGTDAILVAEVAVARPLRPDVQEIYEKYARALIDKTRRDRIEGNVVQAYDRFGLVPRVALQRGGRAQLPSAVSATDSGFEVQVRKHLPYLQPAVLREQLFKNESRVCRVELNDGSGTMGTGFLVGPEAVLTNYHVVKSVIDDPTLAAGVRCRFDHKELANGTITDSVVVGLSSMDWLIDSSRYSEGEAALDPDSVAPTEDELDYALLRLDRRLGSQPIQPGVTGSPERGWITIPAALPAITPEMPILILQHPNSGPIKLALDTNAQVSVLHHGRRIRYKTNTEAGSSGSPCFDLNWHLIALHHYGDPKGFFGAADYNQGVAIDAIYKRLSAQGKLDTITGPRPAGELVERG